MLHAARSASVGFRDLKNAKGTKGSALFSHEATEESWLLLDRILN